MLNVRDIAAHEKSLVLTAGEGGLAAPVSRTHMVESMEIARSFVGAGELIFTTGAGLSGEGELPEFIGALQKSGASGVVVNLGPYIHGIPEAVAAFARENSLPLFTCAWDVRMAEIMHRVGFRIEESSRDASKAAQALRSAATGGEWRTLKKLGFGEDARFYVAVLAAGEQAGGAYRFAVGEAEAAVFVNTEREDVRRAIGNARAAVSGPCGMAGIAGAFAEAKKLLALSAAGVGARFLDESGVLQLLLGIRDRELLESYCESQLGRLSRYDAKKKSGLMEVLDTYIRCGSSLKEASERLGVHKNTVTNRVKKCGEILGRDLTDPAARMDVEIAILARRILALPE